jgi:hypothetical protein
MRPYIAREWRRCCADPRRFAFLFGAALVYLVLFAVLFAPNIITEVPCVIYDEDQSALSRKLAQKFEDNERFGIIAYAATQEETLALLREKEALAAIVIPKGFAKSIQTGSYTTLLCVANGANLMPIGAATGDGENIAAEFSDEIALRREELRTGRNEAALGNRVVPVRHELRVLNNLVSGYFDFAEISAIEHRPMYMKDYIQQLDAILSSGGRQLLTDAGKVSHAAAIEKAHSEYRKYQQKTLTPVEKAYLKSLKAAEKEVKTETRKGKR